MVFFFFFTAGPFLARKWLWERDWKALLFFSEHIHFIHPSVLISLRSELHRTIHCYTVTRCQSVFLFFFGNYYIVSHFTLFRLIAGFNWSFYFTFESLNFSFVHSNTKNLSLSQQRNQERHVLTPVTSWTAAEQAMTISLAPRSPITVTMVTPPWAGPPSPVSWGMMGNQCGIKPFRRAKVGDAGAAMPQMVGLGMWTFLADVKRIHTSLEHLLETKRLHIFHAYVGNAWIPPHADADYIHRRKR